MKTIPKKERCSEPNIADSSSWHFCQCSRRGTITEEGKIWCFQHAPSAKRKRRAESNERFNAETMRRNAPYQEIKRLRTTNAALLEALERFTDWMTRAGGCDVPWPGILQEADEQARAAIEAAKGD